MFGQGRGLIFPTGFWLQISLLHNPQEHLLIDTNTFTTQGFGSAPVAIGLSALIEDGFDFQLQPSILFQTCLAAVSSYGNRYVTVSSPL